jgi:transcriptional regulator of acetoin/glycerol metabolism
MTRKVLTQLEAQKRRQFLDALKAAGGNISKASYELGISRQTAYRWIDKWDLYSLIEHYKDFG